MTQIKVSLVNRDSLGSQNNKSLTPFWFTTDWSIKLSHRTSPTANVILERLSERSLLELKAAYSLGLVILDRPEIFNAV